MSPRRALGIVGLAVLLAMSPWFAASAVAPQLRELWRLNTAQTGWLTTVVQLGFVAGTAVAAVLNLADTVPLRGYFTACALLAATANGAVALLPGYGATLGLRFATGFFLAGVYPPAMKMAATWYREGRGLAIGAVVGALTIGKAGPYLVHALPHADALAVLRTASISAAAGGLLVGGAYRDGPFPFPRRPFSLGLVAVVVRHRETRLATAGYLGHMWELYAMWTWVPAFLAASIAARDGSVGAPSAVANLLAFGAIAAGGLGCLWGGWAAARIGYAAVVTRAMAISGICCLLIGSLFGHSLLLLAPVMLLWGFFVVADSAQFSAMVTEAAPAHAVGTALTLQTCLGFLLTMVTIQLVPRLAERAGWPYAFTLLAVGPGFGIGAIRRLAARP